VDVAIERRDEWRQRGELDPPPLVTGNDLRLLGLKPGPQYRTILDAIREKQLDGDFHTRDDAIAFAKALSVGATRQ